MVACKKIEKVVFDILEAIFVYKVHLQILSLRLHLNNN